MDKILERVINIDKNNKFLKYIVKRIRRDNYRGLHISQHNRYDLKYVEIVIKTIYENVKDDFFEIPRGDYSNRTGKKDYDINDYPTYKNLVDTIYKHTKKGSYNSIKKNFFVDFDRLGILRRYNKNKEILEGKRGIFYAKLTPKAISFINSKSIFEKYRIFTDFLDNLFSGYLSDLADLIYDSNYENSQISRYEFMFILSDTQLDSNLKVNLLNEFRKLKEYQKNEVIKRLKEYADPKKFKGDKNSKRDFHNWENEIQQILSLMKQTSYFLVDKANNYFMLNTGNNGIYTKEVIKRSHIVKSKYFKIHHLNKITNFELHHIIPISKARNKKEAENLDNVYNLIYLHKNKHREITKNNNANVYLCINPEKILLFDFNENFISAQNEVNAIYSKDKRIINSLKSYNRTLIKQIYDFNDEIVCNE